MKNTIKIFVILTITAVFFACKSGPSEKELELQARIDSLELVNNQSKDSMKEYVKAINEIQAGLDEIKEQEKILTSRASGDNELQETDVEAINNDIESIYDLMIENRKKLNHLRDRLKKSGTASQEFKTTIERLTVQMNEKDKSIKQLQELLREKDLDLEQLNDRLNKMATDIEDLEQESGDKSEIIELQTAQLNTAYFIIGKKSDLKEKGILSREGGFIGIGGVQKIKQKESEFTQIDIRERTVIDLKESSKVILITDHPKSSYSLQTNEDNKYTILTIDDIDSFWSMSKYLVISIK